MFWIGRSADIILEFLSGRLFIFQTGNISYVYRETSHLNFGTVSHFLTKRTTGQGLSVLIPTETTHATKVSSTCCNWYNSLASEVFAHENQLSVFSAARMNDISTIWVEGIFPILLSSRD